MYPLLELGPLRLASGGLLLIVGILLAHSLFERLLQRRGGDALLQASGAVIYVALAGAIVGGRLWFGLFHWQLYSQHPQLWYALRVNDFGWGGAFLGAWGAAWLWCRWKKLPSAELADAAALALPVAYACASLGLLLSGEAYGAPTRLAWGIELFGASRNPTQILLLLSSILTGVYLWRLAARPLPSGSLFRAWLAYQALSILWIEGLRGDSLVLIGGIRVNQVICLALLVGIIWIQPRAQQTLQTSPDQLTSIENA
jgi:phosphatidylglycerol:prolipoprotein diacylglycerol transferase